MGLMLPVELVDVLALIGLNWPEADEEKLFDIGQVWLDLAGQLKQLTGDADRAAAQAWAGSQGDAIKAFQDYWTRQGPPRGLETGAEAGAAFGAGLMIYAAVVLALKINVIVQLVILAAEIAEAIATAGPTFGASLLEIPVFQQLTRAIVEGLSWQVIGEILGA